MRSDHQILGVNKDATTEEVKKAYRLRALELHPDVNDSPDAHRLFIELNNAYRALTEPRHQKPPQARARPRPSTTYTPPPPKRDIWGDPIREDPLWGPSVESYQRPSFRFHREQEKEKEVDLWGEGDSMALYWKEYDRLKSEMAYEDTELFWQKLEEFWQRTKK